MIDRSLILIMVLMSNVGMDQECFGNMCNSAVMDSWSLTMPNSKDVLISAQVLLRPASGKTIDFSVPITAENLTVFAPSPSTVTSASEIFRAGGFEVGLMVGVSFSITGKISTFEKFFGKQVQMGKNGAYEFLAKGKVIGHELSSTELPKKLLDFVAIVVFPPPYDFFR